VNRKNSRSVQQDENTPICRKYSVSFIVREDHAHEALANMSAYLRLVFSKFLKGKSLKTSTGTLSGQESHRDSILKPRVSEAPPWVKGPKVSTLYGLYKD